MKINSDTSHQSLKYARRLPCCFFPTRAIVVAQTAGLSRDICNRLQVETTGFENPDSAFGFLKSYYPKVIEHSWIQTQINHLGLSIESIDTSMIQSIAQNPLSNQDISVIIVEHEMPSLNGLELLTKLSDKPFKMALLIEPEAESIALNLLDRQYIQQYFVKNDPELSQKISSAIYRLQRNYFDDLSRDSREILAYGHPLFSNREMIDFFDDQIQKHQITDFYISSFQNNGVTYMCIDKSNQKHVFSLYAEEDLAVIADYGKSHGVSLQCVEAIQSGQKIPAFGLKQNYQEIDPQEWEKTLLPTEPVRTAIGQYFAILSKI